VLNVTDFKPPEMPSLNRRQDEEPRLFNTVDEVAKELRTNRKTIYDAIARGEIPAVRIGRALRVPSAWLRRVAA